MICREKFLFSAAPVSLPFDEKSLSATAQTSHPQRFRTKNDFSTREKSLALGKLLSTNADDWWASKTRPTLRFRHRFACCAASGRC